MTSYQKLQAEMSKVDLHLSLDHRKGAFSRVDFALTYSPSRVYNGAEHEGIVVGLHRLTGDKYGETGLLMDAGEFELNLGGLMRARKRGIELAKRQYGLEGELEVVEGLPQKRDPHIRNHIRRVERYELSKAELKSLNHMIILDNLCAFRKANTAARAK